MCSVLNLTSAPSWLAALASDHWQFRDIQDGLDVRFRFPLARTSMDGALQPMSPCPGRPAAPFGLDRPTKPPRMWYRRPVPRAAAGFLPPWSAVDVEGCSVHIGVGVCRRRLLPLFKSAAAAAFSRTCLLLASQAGANSSPLQFSPSRSLQHRALLRLALVLSSKRRRCLPLPQPHAHCIGTTGSSPRRLLSFSTGFLLSSLPSCPPCQRRTLSIYTCSTSGPRVPAPSLYPMQTRAT